MLGNFTVIAQDFTKKASETNVIYGMHSGLALLMDIYRPSNPNGHGIIVIPGSGFHQLMSYDAEPLNKNSWYLENIIGTNNLLNNGYTLFVINHRSSPLFRYPAHVEDAQRAVQFIRHNAEKYQIEKERLGAIGHSSGAHLVSMLGTLNDIQNTDSENPIERESSKVEAVVGLAGVYNLTKFAKSGFGDIGAVASYIGTHLPTWRGKNAPKQYEFELYANASPTEHVTNDDAAFFLIHGTNEKVTHPDESSEFHQLLLKNGVNSNLLIIENAGHGLRVDGKVAIEQYYNPIINFFDREIAKR